MTDDNTRTLLDAAADRIGSDGRLPDDVDTTNLGRAAQVLVTPPERRQQYTVHGACQSDTGELFVIAATYGHVPSQAHDDAGFRLFRCTTTALATSPQNVIDRAKEHHAADA